MRLNFKQTLKSLKSIYKVSMHVLFGNGWRLREKCVTDLNEELNQACASGGKIIYTKASA